MPLAMTPTPILLVITATKWLAAGQMPRALHRAGFEVSVLAPPDSLAERSRYVHRLVHFAAEATPREWAPAFAAAVADISPRLLVPCDDTAVRLLQSFATAPPPGMQPAEYAAPAALARVSLGDPAHFRTSVDKTRLPAAAVALGVRVPPFVVVSRVDEARTFAAACGYPVVLKRGHGAAGEWVAIVSGEDDLVPTFTRFAATAGGEGQGAVRILVQAHVAGRIVSQAMVAWEGRVLAGYAREKLVTHPPTGPATVVRCLHAPQIRRFSEQLAIGLGLNGFFGLEYIVDARTDEAYLLEINRRATPATPLGAMIGLDLCAALYAAVNGAPQAARRDLDPGEEHRIAHFPQEWLRDPNSAYLWRYRVDAPWDDPGVMSAMLALRHDA
jgi:biotin carboxylase